ncbi:MAG TPA: helix-turn-helix domain-containing protein [Steroidobacteraceae bacterium]|nr:helix-turn-helix domain-containing protein [Steroidobacteraceae bacterium]
MGFSSSSLPPVHRVTGYESALRRYFSSFGTRIDVEVQAPRPDDFDAALQEFAIGTLGGALHRSNAPHFLHAHPPGEEAAGMDFYVIRDGQIRFTGENGSVDLAAGDMALLRSDGGFSARSTSIEMIVLGLPDALLGGRAGLRGWGVNRRFRGNAGLGACLHPLLFTAAAEHAQLSGAEAAVIQSALVDSIMLLGAADPLEAPADRASRQRETLAGIKAIALRSLHLQNLDPAGIAREAGISVRTLHRAFYASGATFGGWLRDQRLARCWNELTDPCRLRNTIASVAFAWGFSDLRTFNRAFAARYGMTPQAARQSANQNGMAPSPRARS